MLLLGDSSGTVWMWRIPSGDTKTFQGESSRNTCADLTSDGQYGVLGRSATCETNVYELTCPVLTVRIP